MKVKLGHICKVPDPHQVPNKCYLPPHSPHISGTRDHCSFSLGCVALARAQGIWSICSWGLTSTWERGVNLNPKLSIMPSSTREREAGWESIC